METVVEFSKLEKIELGGIKGKVLSQQVVDIFEAFQAEYKVFTEATYDSLDPNDPVSRHSKISISSLQPIYKRKKNRTNEQAIVTTISVVVFELYVPYAHGVVHITSTIFTAWPV